MVGEVTEKLSGKQVCELISKHWKEYHNIDKTWEEIWNYSPHGELMMIWEWWYEAVQHEKEIERNADGWADRMDEAQDALS